MLRLPRRQYIRAFLILITGCICGGCSLCLFGCAHEQTAEINTEFDELFTYCSDAKPTEQQIIGARRLGATQSDIDKMQRAGMTFNEWEHIVPGTAMLEYFDTKYPDVRYEVESMLSEYENGYYILRCSLSDEPDETFEITLENNEGIPHYHETYFMILAAPEYERQVSDIIFAEATVAGIPEQCYVASIELCGSDDNDNVEMAFHNLLNHNSSIVVYVAQTANLSEESYHSFVDACINHLKDERCCTSYRFDYVLDDFDKYSLTVQNAVAVESSNWNSTLPTYQWRVSGTI